MQALRNTLELIRTRMAGLPASAKLLAGSLLVILALGLFLVAQWSATTSSVTTTAAIPAAEMIRAVSARLPRGLTGEMIAREEV